MVEVVAGYEKTGDLLLTSSAGYYLGVALAGQDKPDRAARVWEQIIARGWDSPAAFNQLVGGVGTIDGRADLEPMRPSRSARRNPRSRNPRGADPMIWRPNKAQREERRALLDVKVGLVDRAFDRYPIGSFADVGACWGAHGGYTFHALERYRVTDAVMLDGDLTAPTKERAMNWPQLRLEEGDLGDRRLLDSVGKVDALIIFDILVHQVDPDWDVFLRRYAEHANFLIIYHQCFVDEASTVRFIDRGLDYYLAHTPYVGQEAEIADWFSRHEQPSRKFDRKVARDSYHYWQWGITQADLIRVIWEAGFQVDFLENFGPWWDLPCIENHGFLCSRRSRNQSAE